MVRSKMVMGVIGVFTLFCGMVSAGELGDKAKALNIKEWVKGEKVDVTDGKNIYVVEFWATWCPPCLKTIPHLTELQKKYADKGVKVIGISSEDLDVVKPFVEKQGDKMNYVVAVDDKRGTSSKYMEEFSVGGIPHAFVVDRSGSIVWHGHPMSGMDDVLDKVIAGTFDPEEAAKRKVSEAKEEKLKGLVTVLQFMMTNMDDEKALIDLLKKRILKLGSDNKELVEAINNL